MIQQKNNMQKYSRNNLQYKFRRKSQVSDSLSPLKDRRKTRLLTQGIDSLEKYDHELESLIQKRETRRRSINRQRYHSKRRIQPIQQSLGMRYHSVNRQSHSQQNSILISGSQGLNSDNDRLLKQKQAQTLRIQLASFKQQLQFQKAIRQHDLEQIIDVISNRYKCLSIQQSRRSDFKNSSPTVFPIILQTLSPPPQMQMHPYHIPCRDYDYPYEQDPRIERFVKERKEKQLFRKRKPKRSPIILRKNKRTLKKCFLAVYFVICLKKWQKDVMRMRRLMFDNFWPNKFQIHMKNLKNIFTYGSQQFFKTVMSLDLNLQIATSYTIDFHKESSAKKSKVLKQVIYRLFDQLDLMLQENSSSQKLIIDQKEQIKLNYLNIIHIFCKHGSFIKNQLLTASELGDVCISEKHGYIRMDKNLEKSMIINFLFIKLLLYNMILRPGKVIQTLGKEEQDEEHLNNFHIIGSIIYHIFMDLRDDYLSNLTSDNYPLGNWKLYTKKYSFAAGSPLIISSKGKVRDTKINQNQLISGLLSREKCIKMIGNWSGHQTKAKRLVEELHQRIVSYHDLLISKLM